MKLDAILAEWKVDVEIDKTELSDESVRIPKLHHKYLEMLTSEVLLYKKLLTDYKIMYKVKWEYYLGFISEEELKQRGWKPNLLKILRSDVDIYLSSDNDLTEIKLKQDYQEQKIKALEEIVKSINTRTFIVKNSIEWDKFQHGQ